MSKDRKVAVLIIIALLAASMFAQTQKNSGSLHGQITDPSGAVVTGASVTVNAADGQSLKTVSDKQGNYSLAGVPAGDASVSAVANGFTPYRMSNVIIPAGQSQQLDIAFGIAVKQEQVTVQSESATVDVSPAGNASSTVLKEKDLEALSDDPDELEQDLLALAGPSAGPNGGQIYIDGFSNGTLPPKSSIREIRINQNPFSSEYDRPGFGRVEVFTKPGTDKWHGQMVFSENNSVFNSRNPYVHSNIPDYHTEMYTGNVGGSLSKTMSVFVNAERRNINETAAINATEVDGSGNAIPFTQAVLTPRTRTNLSPRLDWQIAPGNTLTARYQFLKNDEQNQGIGGTTLVSRAYSNEQTQQQLQVSDTQVLSPHLINETRFQYIRENNAQNANHAGLVAINVLNEFGSGGSTVGQSWDRTNRYELQNYTSWAAGKHFVKFGGRLRVSQDTNRADANYNGTFTFNTLADYLSGTPSQFSIAQGNPRAELSYADAGLYAEDDWKLRPNLTLSYGLRFESQTGISDKADFAPRVGLSWGVGNAKSAPKTVVRVGYGIFYDRFGQDLILQAERFNGVTEQQFTYTSGIACTPSPTSSADCSLAGSSSSPGIYQINPNLRSPYTMQSAVSLEQQLGKFGTLSFTYLNSRALHQFVMENVNAPTVPNEELSRKLYSTYGTDNVYQYNSEAIFKQNQLITNVQLRVSQKVSLMGFYALGYANSNSNGASSSPSNQFDLHQDYGRAAFDVRNRLFLSGTLLLAHNIRLSPFVLANSGAPFNITTGQDSNSDTFYNDRPAFATAASNPAYVKSTPLGNFDLNPASTVARIPVNYGRGPASVTVNLRASKTFGFGAETNKGGSQAQGQGGRGGGPGGPPGGGFGAGRGMGGLFANSNTSRRYNLTITAMARNLLNTWNPGSPVGNLSSTLFGKSNGLASGPFSSGTANRRLDLQATFAF